MIGSIVNADTILLPAFTAEFVIFANAVIAITSNAENLALTVSTAFDNPERFILPEAFSTLSSPFVAPSIFKLFLSLAIEDKLV